MRQCCVHSLFPLPQVTQTLLFQVQHVHDSKNTPAKVVIWWKLHSCMAKMSVSVTDQDQILFGGFLTIPLKFHHV